MNLIPPQSSLLCRRGFLKKFHAFLALLFFAGCKPRAAQSGEQAGVRAGAQLPINLGPVSGFPAGRTAVALYRVIVVRENDQLGVLSGVCTHQTCLLNVAPDGLDCPCHGSRFAADGSKISGPAPKSLPWYRATISENRELLVFRNDEVASVWRLTVPAV